MRQDRLVPKLARRAERPKPHTAVDRQSAANTGSQGEEGHCPNRTPVSVLHLT
jgi:hypothetical protein